MPRISRSDFRAELEALDSDPGAIQYGVQDGGTLAPVDRLPPPVVAGSRRNTRRMPRTPNPIGIAGNVIDAVCIPYSLAPETTIRTLGRTTAGFVADRIWNNAVENTVQRVCRDTPNYVAPQPSFPFTGGQCPGVRYEARVTMNVLGGSNCDNATTSTVSRDIIGPIADFRAIPDPTGADVGRVFVQAFARSVGQDLDDPQDWVPIGTRQNFGSCIGGALPTIDSVTVTRVDGLPDVCGNPEPTYPRDNGDITFAPELDIDIAPNVPVQIAPNITVDVDGSINIELPGIGDVTVDIGGIDINLGEGSPDEPGEGAPVRPDPGDTDTDPANPAPPPPPDDPAVEEPEEEPEEVIRAVLVTVTNIESSSSLITQEDTPDVYVPDLGLVSFRCRVSDGASGWTPDIRVKNVRCFVPCPYDGGAIDVQGTPRIGVAWTLTPVYDLSSIPSTP